MAVWDQRANAIFLEALEAPSPEECQAYLEQACEADQELRARVEKLLAASKRATRFLERPAVDLISDEAALGHEDTRPANSAAGDEANAKDDPLGFLNPPGQPGSLGRLDHYEVLEVVGRGGMGVVLKARDTRLERVVALKALAVPLAASATARQRFAREARAAAAVRDDHVVAIHAVEDRGPVPYLVMEFISGCNLEALIRRSGPLEVKEVLRIGIQVASGLEAAHKQGLVHRDVKPANILLENGVQRVKLTDFGLARAADDATLTQPGLIAGTPLYMAPEQAADEPIGTRTDLFSLGSVLYEMCTGRPAFRAPSTFAIIKRICEETPRPLREFNPDVPESVCRLIDRLLAKRPADRPASAKEVANLLAAALAGLQGQGPSASRQAGSSRRWRWAAAALVLLAGLGMGETTGVTNLGGTVLRLFYPGGTLVVEVDDPAVSVTLDDEDLVITGAGVKEIRLKPGKYKVQASKDGKVIQQELVSVARNGRRVVRISTEAAPLPEAQRWERSVEGLPAELQVAAVKERMQELNPGFDGRVIYTRKDDVVRSLVFSTAHVADISPLRALRGLESLNCSGPWPVEGKLSDLRPLRGLPLKSLICGSNPISDLGPLRELPLTDLRVGATHVSDLKPLKGMSLERLHLVKTRTRDLSPLAGMKTLRDLVLRYSPVTDLAPLRDLPLTELSIDGVEVSDLSPIKAMPLKWLWIDYRADREGFLRSLTGLEFLNDKPVAQFWKDVARK